MSRIRWAVLATAAAAVAVAALCLVVASGAGGNAAVASPTTDAPTTTAPPTTAPPTTAPPTTAPPTTAPPTTLPPATTPPAEAPPLTLRPGAEGDAVRQLQDRLVALGYWLGEPDSTYGRLTEQAVMAFQKAHGLERDGIAGPATLAALESPTPLTPRSLTDGVEIDIDRQLILVIEDGSVRWALNTSTGRSGWRTPKGEFVVDRTIDGIRHAPLGDLYRPAYFNGGVAFHGSPSIPGYPASHGCARLTNAAMDMLWSTGVAAVGTPVTVY